MGKVAALAFVAAAVALFNSLGILTERDLHFAPVAIFLFFSAVPFALDLKRFLESPYPFRTKVIDVLLNTLLGDYFEDNRCWFNWKLNLYGNQFSAKENLFDKYEYPALYAYKPLEIDPELETLPLLDEDRNFHPTSKLRFHKQSTWYSVRTTGLEDDWSDHDSDTFLQHLTREDVRKVCFRFFSMGDCHIKLKVVIKGLNLFQCIVEVYRAGSTRMFAEHVEYFTDRRKVELLFAYFEEFQRSPLSGVIDVRKGGERENAKIVHCFRIQDAMKLMKDSRCALIKCLHVDHTLWIL